MNILCENKTTKFIVRPSKLEGEVRLSGAKNCALKLLTVSLLTDEDITITNSPNKLLDMQIHIEMLEGLGKKCSVDQDTLVIKKCEETKSELEWEGPSIRNTLLIFGALLAKTGKARVPLPGGCRIGERKYDLHIMLLEKLGAYVWEEGDYLCGEAKNGLIGTEIELPLRSTGATENGIIAGTLAKGDTIIWNPHIRPEIMDLISFLNSMGSHIDVRGQESIRITGTNALHGTKHTVLSDNLEAITFLIATVITGGDVEIHHFPFKDLEIPLIHLRESGTRYYRGDNSIIIRGGECYPVEIATGPYPAINSDMQPLFAVYGLCARGESRIMDLRFPERFEYIHELKKMGGDFEKKGNLLIIKGGKQLQGTSVETLDLRCGASLLLTGLIAEGETVISNVSQIQRGYENIYEKLKLLHANIEKIVINKDKL